MSTHSNDDIPDSWDDDEIDNNPTLLEIQKKAAELQASTTGHQEQSLLQQQSNVKSGSQQNSSDIEEVAAVKYTVLSTAVIHNDGSKLVPQNISRKCRKEYNKNRGLTERQWRNSQNLAIAEHLDQMLAESDEEYDDEEYM